MPAIHVFDETIQYDVIESEDATEPRIDANIHGVGIILPAGSEMESETVADENAQRIMNKWREYETHRKRAPKRSFEEGEAFLYLGDERQLSTETTDRPRITPTTFVLPATAVEMDVDPGRLELRNQRPR
jgi:hypothetical protein